MIDRKIYEESQLIIRGASISLVSSGGNGSAETFLAKILRGHKWYLGNGGTVLYVEQESFAKVVNLLKESGCLHRNQKR